MPVFLSEDDRYFQDAYQGIRPLGVYRRVRAYAGPPQYHRRAGLDAADRLSLDGGRVRLDGTPFGGPSSIPARWTSCSAAASAACPTAPWTSASRPTAWTWYQTHGTVNYTVSEDFTRITEFKYFSGQEIPNATTIVKEYSRAYTGKNGEIPYYAIINPGKQRPYQQYKALGTAIPASTCWAVWPSISTTIWTPLWGALSWPTGCSTETPKELSQYGKLITFAVPC